eukprot:9316020-Lingulodinium_polyedra.AAC.1
MQVPRVSGAGGDQGGPPLRHCHPQFEGREGPQPEGRFHHIKAAVFTQQYSGSRLYCEDARLSLQGFGATIRTLRVPENAQMLQRPGPH